MCGIVGIVGAAASEAGLRDMLGRIAHRGDPDGGGQRWVGPGAALGANRLAIVDPAGGRQPFRSPDGAVSVFNGEIYNHEELRAELMETWRFRSTCDSEVVLAAWSRWGDGMLHRLRGMWALAIYDPTTGALVLARDPLGIKPLYVAEQWGTTWFGSELKAFTGLPAAEIQSLPPGAIRRDGVRRYWCLPPFATGPHGVEAEREVAAALLDGVRSHLPAPGVPLACLLSGGIDSSTVVTLASRLHAGPVEAWTLAAPGAPSADLAAARELCAHLGVPLRVVSPSVEELGEHYLRQGVRMVETWEPALVRNAVSYHFLCRAVRGAGHKLALSGEGADELFGGYDYLRPMGPAEREEAIRASLSEVHRTYLQMADRASMAATLEVRVPFLDARVVERCVPLPPEARYRDGTNKWALRAAFPEWIPPSIRARAKIGMNGGAGYGSNDPGEGIYHQVVAARYAAEPTHHARDLDLATTLGTRFGVDVGNCEELHNFARFVEAGFHRLAGSERRPRLNVSPGRAASRSELP